MSALTAARTDRAGRAGQAGARTAPARSSRRAGDCPPHYWNIGMDGEGERWDCRQCGAVNRPTPPRFTAWGERACTWSREERILAGLDPDV